jgi:replicative DNA helicase
MLDSPEATMDDVEKAAEELHRRHGSLALVLVDYAQQVADPDPRTPRYLTVGAVGGRGIEIARRFDCAVVVTSQVNVVQDAKGQGKSYTFRETALLEQKCHVGMILVVEWGESNGGPRWVKRCILKSTKGRNISAFELPLRYEPALFSIEDEDVRL